MKIYGIGTDIVNVKRINQSLKNKEFILRIFNKEEIIKCKNTLNSSNCFAKRFAAKEAFSKALGTGIANGIKLNQIIIFNNKSGKPHIRLLGNTKKIVEKIIKKKKLNILLSLSDEKNYAVAFVTITS